MKRFIKRILAIKTVDHFFSLFRSLFFDPVEMMLKWRGIPSYVSNLVKYRKLNIDPSFNVNWKSLSPVLHDRYRPAGAASGHYFWQDLWAATYLFKNKRTQHVTIGSRIDGFVAHVIPFCNITYVDIRPLTAVMEGLEYKPGSILNLPFEDNSIQSMSCLHVIEHIGLGRYGDPVQAEGHLHAAMELKRVLAPGGELLVGAPVGNERLCFDAHRIFDPQTVVAMFAPMSLVEFSLIDDLGDRIIHPQSFDVARKCEYGCGLFIFSK